jgi:hypothetical protein
MPTSLQPAFNYVLQIFSERYSWAFKAHAYKDESFALLLLFIEHHFLSRSHASFAENFYGLKRAIIVPSTAIAAAASTDIPETTALTPKHKLGSLVALVFGPYLYSKAAAWALAQRSIGAQQPSTRTANDQQVSVRDDTFVFRCSVELLIGQSYVCVCVVVLSLGILLAIMRVFSRPDHELTSRTNKQTNKQTNKPMSTYVRSRSSQFQLHGLKHT